MAAALGGEGVDAAAGVAVGVTTAGATPSEAAGSLAAAAGMLDAPTAAAGGDVGGAAAAASVAPPASLFGPHFLLRATSHLVYVAVTVAILFQVLTYLSLLHTSSPLGTAHAYRLARLLVLHAVTVAVTGVLSFYLTPFSAGHLPLVVRAVAVVAFFSAGRRPPETPIAYAAGHSLLRVPVSWLATALAPHVGEVEEALVVARAYYAGARRFVKAVAVAALTALSGMDEDSDSDGGGGGGDDGGDGGGHGAAADTADGDGDAGTARPRPLRVPLEGAYYVEATPAWATAVAAEEQRRTKDAAARRPTGAPDADVWAAAGTDGPGRPLAESPAARMRRRGLRRATPTVGGRPGGPGLLAGALGDGDSPGGVGGSSSSSVAIDDVLAARSRVSGGDGGSGGRGGDRTVGAASSTSVTTARGPPDRPRPRRSEIATDKYGFASTAAARQRPWVRGASSSGAVATAMGSAQRPQVTQSSSDGVATVLGTRGRVVSERRYGPDGVRLTDRSAQERAAEMENLGAYRLVPPTVPGPSGPRRVTPPRRQSMGEVEVSTPLAGVDDAYAELRALRASFRRPRLLGGAGSAGGAGGAGSRASDAASTAAAESPFWSIASAPVSPERPTSPGTESERPVSGASESGRRCRPSPVRL